MSTIKRLILFYFINLLIFLFINTLFGVQITRIVFSSGLWLLPLIFVFLGQVLGFISVIAIERPGKNKKIFHICAIVTSIAFASIVFFVKFSYWKHERDFGNIESNTNYFKYWADDYKKEKMMAFDTLIKKFTNPNEIKLTGSFVNKKDTIIDGYKETSYLLRLIYKKKHEDEKYKADFIIVKNKTNLLYFDKPLDNSDQFTIDSLQKKGTEDINAAIKLLPDSIRGQIKKEFKDIID